MTDQSLPHVGTAFEYPHLWTGIKATLKAWRQRNHNRRYLAQMSPTKGRTCLFRPTSSNERSPDLSGAPDNSGARTGKPRAGQHDLVPPLMLNGSGVYLCLK